MKTIKFRAWEEAEKIMWYGNQLKNFETRFSNDENGELQVFRTDVKLLFMQFTGLLDKNGKEIYEGDIVRHQNGYLYFVEFSQLNAWWCLVQPRNKEGNLLEKVYTGGLIGQDIRKCKVIGNIYENPKEILKNGKKIKS